MGARGWRGGREPGRPSHQQGHAAWPEPHRRAGSEEQHARGRRRAVRAARGARGRVQPVPPWPLRHGHRRRQAAARWHRGGDLPAGGTDDRGGHPDGGQQGAQRSGTARRDPAVSGWPARRLPAAAERVQDQGALQEQGSLPGRGDGGREPPEGRGHPDLPHHRGSARAHPRDRVRGQSRLPGQAAERADQDQALDLPVPQGQPGRGTADRRRGHAGRLLQGPRLRGRARGSARGTERGPEGGEGDLHDHRGTPVSAAQRAHRRRRRRGHADRVHHRAVARPDGPATRRRLHQAAHRAEHQADAERVLHHGLRGRQGGRHLRARRRGAGRGHADHDQRGAAVPDGTGAHPGQLHHARQGDPSTGALPARSPDGWQRDREHREAPEGQRPVQRGARDRAAARRRRSEQARRAGGGEGEEHRQPELRRGGGHGQRLRRRDLAEPVQLRHRRSAGELR